MNETKIFPKVFMWMFVGLLVTFLTGFYVMNNENMLYNIFATNMYWFIYIAEIVVVIFLSARIQKMNPLTAMISFVLYSLLSGLTFSSIFVLFELESIMIIFAITAGLFAIFGLFGFFTHIDLTRMGSILFMALLGIIIATIVNLFLGNETLDIILNWIGIIIFIGYIAYDIQKIKKLSMVIEDENKLAIIGALELYLDFINLFIRLIELFGNRRD